MAATITADMKSRHRQLGRPPKTDTDKRQRQQEAYKKRDASRVYLASSYDRWKRLGGKLGLKDSSLAWHLMEAHATNCDECGMCEDNMEDEESTEHTKSPSQFFPALVRCIHKLCHRHYSFGDCVQVMGLICLEVDNGKKENFSIKEMVHKPFMLQIAQNNNNSTKDMHNEISNNCLLIDTKCSKDLNNDLSEDDVDEDASDNDSGAESDHMETEQISQISHKRPNSFLHDYLSDNVNKVDETIEEFKSVQTRNVNKPEVNELNKSSQSEDIDSSFISVGDEEFNVNDNPKNNVPNTEEEPSSSPQVNMKCGKGSVTVETTLNSPITECSNNQQLTCDNLKSTQSCSEFVPETSNTCQSKHENPQINISPNPSDAFYDKLHDTDTEISVSNHKAVSDNIVSVLKSRLEDCNDKINPFDSSVHNIESKTPGATPEETYHGQDDSYSKLVIDVPSDPAIGLDLSIVKTEQPDNFQSPDNLSKNNSRKRKSSEMDPIDREHISNYSPSYLNGNTRREIVYKVEYEHLEKNPFCDFYELTACYPNIQQRTFYRWKRKIKDEFIFLERSPDMTFEEFAKCIPHAKQDVFDTWKGMIKDGHRFSTIHIGSSDTSPIQSSNKKYDQIMSANPSLSLLQMYPHMSYQEFSYTHPMIPLEIFTAYKQQVLTAISYVEKNPNMEFSDLAKRFTFVSEEAFHAWRKYAQMLDAQKLLKPKKEEKIDNQANMFAIQNAMVQQYPTMLMGAPGMAAYNALITQAMATNNSTGQLFPALMQAAVNQAQHPYLSSQWQQQQSLEAVHSQTRSMLLSQTQQHQIFNPTHHQSSLSKLQSLTQVLCNNMKDSDKSSLSSTSPDTSSPVLPTENILKKQNKNEYLYFIYHLDVTYPEFNVLYPHISNRTFYRWKKEVRDAQGLLNENPHYTYEDLCICFPNIPQDVFNGWKQKRKQSRSKSSPVNVWRPHDTEDYQHLKEPNRILKAVLENDTCNNLIRVPQYKPFDLMQSRSKAIENRMHSPSKKQREEYHYLQLNPRISYYQFEVIYPDVSLNTFYRWKKRINDGLSTICDDPNIVYSKFQSLFQEINEDIFNKWKSYLQADDSYIDEERPSVVPDQTFDAEFDALQQKTPSSEEDNGDYECLSDGKIFSHNKQKKQSRPEYLCLQENPFTELQEVINAFPGVSKRTLYRWKKEILRAVEFVRGQPEISFQAFSVYFPEVLENNFNRWKKAIEAASTALQESDNPLDTCPQVLMKQSYSIDSPDNKNTMASDSRSMLSSPLETISDQTDQERCSTLSNRTEDLSSPLSTDLSKSERKDFYHILENPDIAFETFSDQFPNVLQYTFIKWKNDAHRWISLIMSSPNIDFNIFSIYCPDVPEVIFDKWKQIAMQKSGVKWSLANHQSSVDKDLQVSQSMKNSDPISHDSNLTNSTYYKSLKTLTPRSRKVNLREYHYFLQNPFMTFQELNEMFNTISGRTFYRWKKEVKEKLEYLESNPDTCFKAFVKIFPDVTEDVFNAWKQKASSTGVSKRVPMHSGHWWNMNHQPITEDTKPNLVSESSKESFDSQSSSRYNCPKEDGDREDQEVIQASKSPNLSSQKRLLNSSYEKEDKYLKRETPMDQHYGDTGSTIQQMLHQYSNNYMGYGMNPTSPMYSLTSSILTSSSSPSTYMVNHSGMKHDNTSLGEVGNSPIFPTNTNISKQPISSPITAIHPNTNCDEIYSPKFRKRQREEYCFLQQNPTMDFNEFTAHFPRVSIRTFYRWKKELKDDR